MVELANKILLVEDDPVDAQVFSSLLTTAGLNQDSIVHTRSITEGLAACQSEVFDVVLLDLTLPDASGVTAMNMIAQVRPDLPVVVLTGDDDPQRARDALRVGAEDYLYKGETSHGRLLLRSLTYAIERKQAREELTRLEAHLLKAQRLESLEVLAGGVAHDFNNLLVGIMGNASMALAELPRGSDVLPMITDIERSALLAAELTRQMLAYAGKGRFVVQVNDLGGLISDTQELLRSTVSRNASLRFDITSDFLPVRMDATQIQQTLMNLVSNASEALEGGQGSITVTAGAMLVTEDDPAELDYSQSLQPGQYAFLEVTDSGIGMNAETRARIFDPFYTTKFTGRGLGLAACLGIARGHEGAFRVYSEPGQGTSIKMMLPLSAEALSDQKETDTEQLNTGRNQRLLVVDDNESVRTVTRRILTRAGYDVMLAVDGIEAVSLLTTHRDEIDAVLLDMTMPGLDGEETCRRIRQIKPETKIIMMSGYNEQEVIRRFAGRGLADFLQKPFRAEVLLEKLEAVFAEDETGPPDT